MGFLIVLSLNWTGSDYKIGVFAALAGNYWRLITAKCQPKAIIQEEVDGHDPYASCALVWSDIRIF